MPAKKNTSHDQFASDMQAAGRKLAYLISVAPITDEKRAELIEMVPFLSIAELARLMNILETIVTISSGDMEKDALISELYQTIEKQAKEGSKRAKDLDATLDSIEAELEELGE